MRIDGPRLAVHAGGEVVAPRRSAESWGDSAHPRVRRGISMRYSTSAASLLLLFLASSCGDDDGSSDVGLDADVDARAPLDFGMEECDDPGATETLPCGNCGTVERFCSADGVWVYGACAGETGACEPGTTGRESCGNCGSVDVRCTSGCEWEAVGECADEGLCAPGTRTRSSVGCEGGANRDVLCSDECAFEPVTQCESDPCASPGAIETVECGMCGTTERFCAASGSWEYGACADEGVCVPGTSDSMACGMCGEQLARCSTQCQWLATGECLDEGTCSPGDRRRISAGCPAGQTRLMECAPTCGFTLQVEACSDRDDIDLIFLLETTGSNIGKLRVDLPVLESRCLDPLLAIADVRVGVAYFGDFPISPYGSSGDRPFEGGIEPTRSASDITTEREAFPSFGGNDAEDSLVEGLWSLSGGALASSSRPMSCSAGRSPGGCWRPNARRIIVAHTDSAVHNGPAPSSSGLHAPYVGITPAPATWPNTAARLMASDTELVIFSSSPTSTTPTAQWGTMLDDLGQPATDLVDLRAGVGIACDALVSRVAALRGL